MIKEFLEKTLKNEFKENIKRIDEK